MSDPYTDEQLAMDNPKWKTNPYVKAQIKKMARGKCLRCDKIGRMTEDHVVPQWLVKYLPYFGVSKKELPPLDTEMVCEDCNHTKGGKVDFSYPLVRAVMKPIITKWVAQIRQYEEFHL